MLTGDNRRQRLLRQANFRFNVGPEDYLHAEDQGLEKSIIAAPFNGNWIGQNQNIVITGPTGVGKTFLGCCYGFTAVRSGHTCKYLLLDDFFDLIEKSRVEGSLLAFKKKMNKISVLIIDDFLMGVLNEFQQSALFSILEPRINTNSTIIVGQSTVPEWATKMSNPLYADAIMDRFARAIQIPLSGASRR